VLRDWLQGIAQNIVADLLFLGILPVLGWLAYRLARRRPLLRFFGIEHAKRLSVYLSNLRIQPGGALGVDGLPRSFGESAIPAYEAALMPALQRTFNYVVPGMEALPGFLKRLLLSDVSVEVRPSPLAAAEVESDSTFITVGSPGYNLASGYVEDSLHAIGRFTNDMRAIALPGAPALGGDHYAFVQRAGNARQQAFYVAGITSRATTGAVRFLATRWRRLAEKYPDGAPFCVVLRVTSEDGSNCHVIYERD
jgi:hypothetical protein